MAKLARNPWGILAFSTLVSIVSGIAIIGFGAAPKLLVPITYGTAAIVAGLNHWASHHLGQR
jgi:uncharacterized membrane protein HdeD (DUF308 family)